MTFNASVVSRRTFLRGAGVTMLLPWMESIPVWGATSTQAGTAPALPKRLAVVFMANGINPDTWWARGSGAAMELGPSLEPLVPFRERLLERGLTLVEVPDDEFETMGTNVLALSARRCVMLAGNPKTRAALERAGADVTEYEGSEISVKGAGGPTCLTRPLSRLRVLRA